MKLTSHWVADIFPLNESDVERLAEDIKANGQRQPIIAWKGQIIDGRTRYAACKRAGVEPVIEEYKPSNGEVTDDELLALSRSLNDYRRDLSKSQRACAGAEVANRKGLDHGGDRRSTKSKTKAEKSTLKTVASDFGVGRDYIIFALELLRESPYLFAKVKAGDLTVGAAHEMLGKLKGIEKEEVKRNSLAAIRAADQDLAEQVENGKVAIEEAQKILDAREEDREKRQRDLQDIASGVFVAVHGLETVAQALTSIKATAKEVLATRKDFQSANDRKRIAIAIATIQQFEL